MSEFKDSLAESAKLNSEAAQSPPVVPPSEAVPTAVSTDLTLQRVADENNEIPEAIGAVQDLEVHLNASVSAALRPTGAQERISTARAQLIRRKWPSLTMALSEQISVSLN